MQEIFKQEEEEKEEDTFTEEHLEDVEGKILDFFLGCFTNTNKDKEDSFEDLVKDGKLYGQDYHSIKEECLKSGSLFTDPEFDCDLSYLGERIEWARPHSICPQPSLFVDGTDQFDVIQGELGDCWLLAAMSCLALQPHLLSKVVVPGQSLSTDRGYTGVFHARFWLYGDWIEVVVDDLLPCSEDGKLAFIHSASASEFWSPLLEKAYAKLHGSYQALKGGSTCEAMVDFTGGISETVSLNRKALYQPWSEEEERDLFRTLEAAQTGRSLNCCSIQPHPEVHEAQTNLGLIRGHAYSITKVARVFLVSGVQERLVRVRNPWGNAVEWRGRWCDGAGEWEVLREGERARVGLYFDTDGEWWMSFRDFLTHFHQLELCHVPLRQRWTVHSWHGEWRRGVSAGGSRNHLASFPLNTQYFVTVPRPQESEEDDLSTIIVSLIQKRRRHDGSDYEMLSIGFVIYNIQDKSLYGSKLEEDFFKYTRSIARSKSFLNTREVSGRFRLEPGDYAVIPSTFRPEQEGDFLLRVFTEK